MIHWDAKPIDNFTIWEAQCKCGCGQIILQTDLLDNLHLVRNEYAKWIVVTSWTRCWRWNAAVGGTKTSYHKNGRAIDIKPNNPDDIDLLETIAKKHFAFVLRYTRTNPDGSISEWLHCDIRGERPVSR